MSLISAFGIVTPLILLLFPLAMRTMGAMNFIRINIMVAVLGYAALFFAGNNLPMVLVCAVLGGVGSNCLAMIGGVFIIQTMDYGEWKTGKRVEGLLSSFNSFASKVGSGLASLIVGAVMAIGGYVSQAPTQTPGAIMSVKFVYSVIPCVFCILCLVVLHFFDVDKRIPQITKDLEARKIKAAE
jgi:GPH family glycoside/pentoside/hexuronide:cation symporter